MSAAQEASNILAFKDSELIEALYNRPQAVVRRVVSARPHVSKDLCFTERNKQILYLSLLLRDTYDQRVETSLMSSIFKAYSDQPGDRSFLRHCQWKLSKRALLVFLQGHICNLKTVRRFVGFLAPRLQPNVVELWFENDFEFIDELYGRMDVMALGQDTPFNDRAFSHLLRFKAFRKAVFNGNMNREFVIGMRSYANRGDYDYFYRRAGVTRSLDGSRTRPRDAGEFSFFESADVTSIENITKIRNYQLRIGHNFILSMFVEKNILELCGAAEASDTALDILTEAIRYNSALIRRFQEGKTGHSIDQGSGRGEPVTEEAYKNAVAVNNTAFDVLKKDERLLRATISSFYCPKERTLQDLLTGRFEFSISEAANYINLGYEDALIEYFKTKPVSELLGIVDSWNCDFFLTLFTQTEFDVESAILVLAFVQSSPLRLNADKMAEIYDKIMLISDRRIFERVPQTLRLVYVLRHSEYRLDFVAELAARPLDPTASAYIYELIRAGTVGVVELCRREGVCTEKEISLSEDVIFDEDDVINSLFMSTFVLKSDASYLFIHYFDRLMESILKVLSKQQIVALHETNEDFGRYIASGDRTIERIRLCLGEEIQFGLIEKISFVMKANLENRYLCYAVFDKLLAILTTGSSPERILLLTYLDPAVLVKDQINHFINALIPLLNTSNMTVCRLSKLRFNQIKVETREIQNILPDIVQTFLDRDNFISFLKTFRSIQFNNYLCFNSLNLLLQLFLRSLNEHTSDCFDILKRLINIIKEKDVRYIYGLLFRHISLFVVGNAHSTADALEVATQFCLYASLPDFETLLGSLSSLRIANFLVEILKVKGDSKLNDQIICSVLSRAVVTDGVPAVEPAFVAAACELHEFTQHLNVFIPLLKRLFKSEKIETRQIACKALRSIMSNPLLDEHKQTIDGYLVECCMHPDYFIRLQSLDITGSLPIIFILRHDQHSLVKKKAQDVWKRLVDHTNKELRGIFPAILDYIQYRDNKTLYPALKEVVAEFVAKYMGYLESYLGSDGKAEMKEFIYVEAVKKNRLIPQATEFCMAHFSPELFNLLSKNPAVRDEIVDGVDQCLLYDLCAENGDLAFYLFNRTANPVYIEFISTVQKLEIIKEHHVEHRTVQVVDEDVIFILQSIESSAAVEDLLLRIHPSFSYYYVSVYRTDYGRLQRIFERVFDVCLGLDELVIERNLPYIKGCTLDRIENKLGLLDLLMTRSERPYFEKSVELIRGIEGSLLEGDVLFEVLGYLFRNLLLVNRRAQCSECIRQIYDCHSDRMGYFKRLAEATVIQ